MATENKAQRGGFLTTSRRRFVQGLTMGTAAVAATSLNFKFRPAAEHERIGLVPAEEGRQWGIEAYRVRVTVRAGEARVEADALGARRAVIGHLTTSQSSRAGARLEDARTREATVLSWQSDELKMEFDTDSKLGTLHHNGRQIISTVTTDSSDKTMADARVHEFFKKNDGLLKVGAAVINDVRAIAQKYKRSATALSAAITITENTVAAACRSYPCTGMTWGCSSGVFIGNYGDTCAAAMNACWCWTTNCIGCCLVSQDCHCNQVYPPYDLYWSCSTTARSCACVQGY